MLGLGSRFGLKLRSGLRLATLSTPKRRYDDVGPKFWWGRRGLQKKFLSWVFVPDGIYSVGDYFAMGGCLSVCVPVFFKFHDWVTSKRFELGLKDTESYIWGFKWLEGMLVQCFVISIVFIWSFWLLYHWIWLFKPFSKLILQVKIRGKTLELW